MEHLNGIFARVGRNLNNNFQKRQMPAGGGVGMLKLPFERYIVFDKTLNCSNHSMCLVVLLFIVNHCKSTQSLTASYKVIQKSYTSP